MANHQQKGVVDANLWNKHTYGRDYLGDLTSFDNGQQLNGHEVVLTYNYNSAAHLTSATSSLNDATHPANLLSGMTYEAFGPVSASWGNTVTETQDYTVRGQINTKTDKAQRTGTPGSGTVGIGGAEQSQQHTTPATAGSGYVDVSSPFGGDQSTQILTQQATAGTGTVTISGNNGAICLQWDSRGNCTEYEYDSGIVSITVNGHVTNYSYCCISASPTTIAQNIALAMTNDSGAPATATANGAVVTITSKAKGHNANYPLSASVQNTNGDYGAPTFHVAASGASLTGGQDAVYTTYYDSGTMNVTVNGHATSVTWGQGDTGSGVASRMVSAIQNDSGAYVAASLSGSRVNLTSKVTGQSGNYTLSVSTTYNTTYFSSPSFPPTRSGATLTGGADQQVTTLYDTGTVSVTVNRKTKTASYGQTSTQNSVATDAG